MNDIDYSHLAPISPEMAYYQFNQISSHFAEAHADAMMLELPAYIRNGKNQIDVLEILHRTPLTTMEPVQNIDAAFETLQKLLRLRTGKPVEETAESLGVTIENYKKLFKKWVEEATLPAQCQNHFLAALHIAVGFPEEQAWQQYVNKRTESWGAQL